MTDQIENEDAEYVEELMEEIEVTVKTRNDVYLKDSRGGTELQYHELLRRVEHTGLLDDVQITLSRPNESLLDFTKKRILWMQDTHTDLAAQFLVDPENRDKFNLLVFSSWWQAEKYMDYVGLQYEDATVLRNAINPIELNEAEHALKHILSGDDKIRIMYSAAPHKGLEILVPVFVELYKYHEDKIVLDVCSNFDMYGDSMANRNEGYEELFKTCREHPGINYHGFVNNDTVRELLHRAHIFAYPSTWAETSCISVMEAMSAKALVVCPMYAGLNETVDTFGFRYQWNSDLNKHASTFINVLDSLINTLDAQDNMDMLNNMMAVSKARIDRFYSWDYREYEWQSVLTQLNNIEV